MKKLGLVLVLTAFCLAPVVADAQWGPQSYPYHGTPQVMYQAPPVMYPAPQVVYQAPVMIQVVPEPPRVVVMPAPRPEKKVETRIQGDGVSVVTKCTNCTVTNTGVFTAQGTWYGTTNFTYVVGETKSGGAFDSYPVTVAVVEVFVISSLEWSWSCC